MTAGLLLAILATTTPPLASPAEATALYERAAALVEQGDVAQAVGLLEQAAAIDESLGADRRQQLARERGALGLCLSALGRTDDAVTQLGQAAAIWRALDAPAEQVESLGQLGLVEFSHSRLDGALARFEEALRLAQVHALAGAVPRLRSNLGMVLQAMGRDTDALEQYRAALDHYEAAGDRAGLAAALGNIANLHLVAGRYREAEAAYARARAAFEQGGDTAGVAATDVNLGMVSFAEGDLDRARAVLEEGAERAGRGGLGLVRASALLHLARVDEATGLFDKAEAAYAESLALFRSADSPQNVAAALSGQGSLYLTWGRADRALALAGEALALAERQKLPDQTMGGLELLASAERASGRTNAAVSHYRQALEVATRLGREADQARVENELGTALVCWRKPREAEPHFRESLRIAERLGQKQAVSQAFIHLGAVSQLEGDQESARGSYLRGLEAARAAGAAPDEAIALNNLGVLALSRGDRREAKGHLLQAIALEERFRLTAKGDDRASSLAPWISAYRWLVWLHFLEGDAGAVFDASERIKARYLAERMAAGRGQDEPTAGIETFRQGLAPNAAVVSFANVDWPYPVAVVATRAKIQTYALDAGREAPGAPAPAGSDSSEPAFFTGAMPRGSALAGLLAEYRELLALEAPAQRQRARRDALARRLFAILFGPAESLLAGADELVVISDGSLSLVPLETLRLPDGRFLVERYHVTYQPSLRVMQLLGERGHAAHSRSLLAMGGASYGTAAAGPPAPREVSARQRQALRATARRRLEGGKGVAEVYAELGRGGWADLPGARAEVEAIGRIVPESVVFSGEEVSEARLKSLSRDGTLRQFAVLHFATHGVTVPDAPELSALVLAEAGRAGESAEDGYLSAEEISGLDLRPDFVSLSACDSGLGRIYGGEGPVGLTQAFLRAGANGVSVSLWQIRDRFARDFMVALYRAHERGMSYAKAITAVKRSLLRRGHTDPFLWAPFVYYGAD